MGHMYVSPRRFVAHVFLSLSAVITAHTISQASMNFVPMGIYASSACGIILRRLSELGLLGNQASKYYVLTTSWLLLYLYKVIESLESYLLEDGQAELLASQYLAIHFASAFWVLTELEFYREYLHFEGVNTWRVCPLRILLANDSLTFAVSREAMGYMLDFPATWKRCINDERELFNVRGVALRKSDVLWLPQIPLFHVVGGFLNYAVKVVVGCPYKGDTWRVIGLQNIFFKTDTAGKIMLTWMLLRVVRQANHLAFWGVVRSIRVVWKWREKAEAGAARERDSEK